MLKATAMENNCQDRYSFGHPSYDVITVEPTVERYPKVWDAVDGVPEDGISKVDMFWDSLIEPISFRYLNQSTISFLMILISMVHKLLMTSYMTS